MKKLNFISIVFTLIFFSSFGQSPTSVNIGSQVWTTENLSVDKFRNGNPIPQAKTKEEWIKALKKKQPAWCYYNNDPANGKIYGKLYNKYAVHDKRGIAPKGWHIPTGQEWIQLTDYLGQGNPGTSAFKMQTSTGWENNGDNSSGFSALPGGCRKSAGDFSEIGKEGIWWCTTRIYSSYVWHTSINYNFTVASQYSYYDEGGYYIRCVRD